MHKTCSSKSLEKYKIMRKLLSDTMVPSSPEWRVIALTTLQKHDKYGQEFSIRNAHMVRIVFVLASGVRR